MRRGPGRPQPRHVVNPPGSKLIRGFYRARHKSKASLVESLKWLHAWYRKNGGGPLDHWRTRNGGVRPIGISGWTK